MNYTIRKSVKSDMPQVLDLINELAIYEKEPDAVEVTLKDLENDGFGENPAFYALLPKLIIKLKALH